MSTSNRLTALACKTLGNGLHADGNGLYLRVKSNRRNWVYIYHIDKRRREMGLGAFGDVTLAEARAKAGIARASVKDGIDPLASRTAEELAGATFEKVAADFIELKKSGWRNAKHADQWSNTLRKYAKPISEMEVAKITTTDVLSCLKPIWSTKPETASRVRMRIANILDAAKAWGLRTGENPASWSDNLVHLLPPRAKLSRGHQRAMSFEDAPAFMHLLRERESVAARALEFTILTAVRTSETLNARWSEVDWSAKVWNIPPARTKTATLLRVPLSDAAVANLNGMRGLDENLIFPSVKRSVPLSINAMSAVLDRMGFKADATVHGFRSTFRDWAGETTDFPRDIVEMALGHAVGSAVERAYRRGDALERRRAVMEAWAAFLTK